VIKADRLPEPSFLNEDAYIEDPCPAQFSYMPCTVYIYTEVYLACREIYTQRSVESPMRTVQDWLPSLINSCPSDGADTARSSHTIHAENQFAIERTETSTLISKVQQRTAAFEALQERFGSLAERSTAEPGSNEKFQRGTEQLAEAGWELHEVTDELERQTARGKELSDSLRLDIQYLKEIAETGAGAAVGTDSEFEQRTWRMAALLQESRAVEKAVGESPCWTDEEHALLTAHDRSVGREERIRALGRAINALERGETATIGTREGISMSHQALWRHLELLRRDQEAQRVETRWYPTVLVKGRFGPTCSTSTMCTSHSAESWVEA
jgi:hypothetical protein